MRIMRWADALVKWKKGVSRDEKAQVGAYLLKSVCTP